MNPKQNNFKRTGAEWSKLLKLNLLDANGFAELNLDFNNDKIDKETFMIAASHCKIEVPIKTRREANELKKKLF